MRKFSLFINIAVICLCVATVAFGIYAITEANLNMGGSIGFKSHACSAEISGYIYGHAQTDGVDDVDGTPVAQPEDDADKQWLTTTGGVQITESAPLVINNSTGAISLGTRYFSDKGSAEGTPSPIVIVLNVKNTSQITIGAMYDATKVTNKPSSVKIETDNQTIIAKGETKTITITLTLEKTGDAYESIEATTNNLTIPLEFEVVHKLDVKSLGSKGDGSQLTETLGDDNSILAYIVDGGDPIIPESPNFTIYCSKTIEFVLLEGDYSGRDYVTSSSDFDYTKLDVQTAGGFGGQGVFNITEDSEVTVAILGPGGY